MIEAVLTLPGRRPVAVAALMVGAMVAYQALVAVAGSTGPAPPWLGWMLAVVLTWAIGGLFLAPRLRSGSKYLAAVMLGAAASPGFVTGSARLLGGPDWLGVVGVAVSVSLLVWAVGVTRAR